MRSTIFVFLFLPLVCRAEPPSLCRATEQLIFNCTAGKKIASICASSSFTPTSGYVQYRFGSIKKLDFEYPETPSPPKGFFWMSTTAYSGGGQNRIRFVNNGYRYIVFDQTVRTGFGEDGNHDPDFSAGVNVKAPAGKATTLVCTNDASIHASAYDGLDREDYDNDFEP